MDELERYLWQIFKQGVSTPSYLGKEQTAEKFQIVLEETKEELNRIKNNLKTK